jgi:hypothetical protein
VLLKEGSFDCFHFIAHRKFVKALTSMPVTVEFEIGDWKSEIGSVLISSCQFQFLISKVRTS